MDKQEGFKEIEAIVNKGYGYRDEDDVYKEIVAIEGRRIPVWTFKMLLDLFGFFLVNKGGITFKDMLRLDSMSAGHSDYDKQITYNALTLFTGK